MPLGQADCGHVHQDREYTRYKGYHEDTTAIYNRQYDICVMVIFNGLVMMGLVIHHMPWESLEGECQSLSMGC